MAKFLLILIVLFATAMATAFALNCSNGKGAAVGDDDDASADDDTADTVCDYFLGCLGSNWNDCTYTFGSKSCVGTTPDDCYQCCSQVPDLLMSSGLPVDAISCFENCSADCFDPTSLNCTDVDIVNSCIVDCYSQCGLH